MELTRGSICPVCGKNHSEVKGNCEVNRDKDFYGGRISFFQTKQCDCGRKYKLCIAQTGDGLKVIDMIILDNNETISTEKVIVRPDEKKEEVVVETNKEVSEPKRNYNYQLNPVVEETPSIIAEMDSAKSKLLMLTKKELHTLLRRRKISFNKNLATKEELVNKLLLRNPTGVGLFK